MTSNTVRSALYDLQRKYPSGTESGRVAEGAKRLLVGDCLVVKECIAMLVQHAQDSLESVLVAINEVRTSFPEASGPNWPHLLADLVERCQDRQCEDLAHFALSGVATSETLGNIGVAASVMNILNFRKARRDQKRWEENWLKSLQPESEQSAAEPEKPLGPLAAAIQKKLKLKP